jgi:hypothetical protein
VNVILGEELGETRISDIMRSFKSLCRKRVDIYIIGGAAMAIRGEKIATKDIDLVLAAPADIALVREILEKMGVTVNVNLSERRLTPIPPPALGITVDLFSIKICNKLTLSPGMISRAEPIDKESEWARFYILSREDIFLLKSVTDRERDLDEMAILLRKGIDGQVLINECAYQDSLNAENERIWETFLLQRAQEIKAKYDMLVPWLGELERIAKMKLGSTILMEKLRTGLNTYREIAEELSIPERSVKTFAVYSEEQGLISIDRTKRPHRLSVR